MSTLETFIGLDKHTQQTLKELWPYVEKDLQSILDDFYNHLLKFEETKAILEGHELSVLKGAQRNHWKKTFLNGIDSDYLNRVTRIGQAHERIGLRPKWYIGGYAFISNRLIETVFKNAPKKRFSVDTTFIQKNIQAVNKILSLDMAQAISIYYDEVKNTTNQQITSAVERFQHGVTQGVDTVAAATEEFDQSIGTIASQVEQSTSLFNSVNQNTQEATEKVSNVYTLAGKINEIANFIKDISDQTNLLALNASIEAARAGDAGKGFAVVADEVKKLATSTDQATANIQEQIQEIQSGSQVASESIEGVSREMDNILQNLNDLSGAVSEQKMASGDIAQNINNISQNVQNVGNEIISELAQSKN